jgi:type IV pilus assembly protein PilA
MVGFPRTIEVANVKKGFTLIELLVVVAIVGILSAIAIPNLLLAVQRAKQRRTMIDIRDMATAWEARNTEQGGYNAAGGVEGADQEIKIDDVKTMLAPTYIRTMPTKDAWGNDFACFADQGIGTGIKAQKYAIISGGHDGTISSQFFSGAFTNYDCDIVYSQGVFVSYPDGVMAK